VTKVFLKWLGVSNGFPVYPRQARRFGVSIDSIDSEQFGLFCKVLAQK
jgi:hypothetical protein